MPTFVTERSFNFEGRKSGWSLEACVAKQYILPFCISLALGLGACGPRTIRSMIFPERYLVESTMAYVDGGRVRQQTVVTQCVVRDVSDSANNVPFSYEIDGETHWIPREAGGILVLQLSGHYPCLWQQAPAPGSEQRAPERVFRNHLFGSWLIDDVKDPRRIEDINTAELFAEHEGYPRLLSFTARVVSGKRPTRALEAAFPGVHRLSGERERTSLATANHAAGPFVGVKAVVMSGEDEVGYLPASPDPTLFRFVARSDSPPQRLVELVYYSSAPLPLNELGTRPWFPQLCVDSDCAEPPDPDGTGSRARLPMPGSDLMVEMSASTIGRSPADFGVGGKRR